MESWKLLFIILYTVLPSKQSFYNFPSPQHLKEKVLILKHPSDRKIINGNFVNRRDEILSGENFFELIVLEDGS